MTIIAPTIGRIVWFTPSIVPVPDTRDANYGDQPFAAIVTYVHNDRMINLVAFDHIGQQQRHTSVPLVQEGDAKPDEGRFASWMPYQLGQAKKHGS